MAKGQTLGMERIDFTDPLTGAPHHADHVQPDHQQPLRL